MAPILALTVRQLAGSRRVWLLLTLVSLPLLVAALFHLADSTTYSAVFADRVTARLVASGILPLVMLLFGTSAFGDEVGDRTLVYLALKPLPRWRIVAPKMLASLVVGGLPVAVSGLAAVAVIEQGDPGGAIATGVGLLVGAPFTPRSSRGPDSPPATRSSSASSTCSSGRPHSRRTSTASAS